MRDRLVVGLAAGILVAPICLLCIVGPVVLVSVLGGVTGWIGGLDPVVAAGLAVLAAISVYGIVIRRKARHRRTGRLVER